MSRNRYDLLREILVYVLLLAALVVGWAGSQVVVDDEQTIESEDPVEIPDLVVEGPNGDLTIRAPLISLGPRAAVETGGRLEAGPQSKCGGGRVTANAMAYGPQLDGQFAVHVKCAEHQYGPNEYRVLLTRGNQATIGPWTTEQPALWRLPIPQGSGEVAAVVQVRGVPELVEPSEWGFAVGRLNPNKLGVRP